MGGLGPCPNLQLHGRKCDGNSASVSLAQLIHKNQGDACHFSTGLSSTTYLLLSHFFVLRSSYSLLFRLEKPAGTDALLSYVQYGNRLKNHLTRFAKCGGGNNSFKQMQTIESSPLRRWPSSRDGFPSSEPTDKNPEGNGTALWAKHLEHSTWTKMTATRTTSVQAR